MVGWHHRLNGHKFEQAPGVGEGQESLACCSTWGRKELDTTEHWTTMAKKMKVLVARSNLTLCNPTDYSQPGPSVHGILQARILGWVAIPFSRGSSQPRDWTWLSTYIAGGQFISEPPGKPILKMLIEMPIEDSVRSKRFGKISRKSGLGVVHVCF